MCSVRFRAPPWLGAAPLFCLCLSARTLAAADTVDTVQQAAVEWAKLRSETTRLESDWQWQRDALEAALTALRARVTKLEDERNALKGDLDRESASTAEAAAENEKARAGLQTVDERLGQLVQQLVAVRPFLPPRLAEGLELAFKSIEDKKLGPAERMQHVVTIFNRCGAFNKSLTFAEQELALGPSGETRLLEVLYVGLSHAYAYDRTNRTAYFGHPENTGWVWAPRPEAAGEVERMIAIYHEETDPGYVAVPAHITDPFAGRTQTGAAAP